MQLTTIREKERKEMVQSRHTGQVELQLKDSKSEIEKLKKMLIKLQKRASKNTDGFDIEESLSLEN